MAISRKTSAQATPATRKPKEAKPKINTRFDSGWFKGRLAELDVKQHELAQALGIDPAATSLLLKGKRNMRVEEAGIIANTLKVPVDDVLHHAGVKTSVTQDHMTIVVGWVDAEGAIHTKGIEGAKRVARPAGLDSTGQALRYQCEGPLDGALVYFQPGEGVEPTAIGRMSVVTTEDGQKLLRTVKRGYDRGMFSVTRLSGADKKPEQLALVSAYPVQWMRF